MPPKPSLIDPPNAGISIAELLDRLDRMEQRSSAERREQAEAFGARIEAEADRAHKDAHSVAETLGTRLVESIEALGQRVAAGDEALGKRLDDLRGAFAEDRAATRLDAASARKENRALLSLMLVIIAGFGGLNLYMKADGSVGVSQPVAVAIEADAVPVEEAAPMDDPEVPDVVAPVLDETTAPP